MLPTSPCPSAEDLSAYGWGLLSEESFAQIDEHLDICSNCQAKLREIEQRPDLMVEKLRQGPPEDLFAQEASCRKAVSLAQALCLEPPSLPRPNRHHGPAAIPVRRIRVYQLLEKLGEGGMGTVYKAVHTELDKIVALKVLSARRVNDSRAVARFKREMKAVGKLDHPQIVRALDAGEEDGTHYLVMEFVDGWDVGRIVDQLGPLPVADACEIVRQAALGLHHAHEAGLVHRDVKPSNVMLAQPAGRSRDGEMTIKLLDLGLALLADRSAESLSDLTAEGQMMGTLDYMAPEQSGDTHSVDIRADIYSLGATLYKLLCGDAPLSSPRSATPLQKMRALVTERIAPIDERRTARALPALPAELAIQVHRLLQRDPARRPATPGEVATVLAPFCAGHNLADLAQRMEQCAGVAAPARGSTVDERSQSPSVVPVADRRVRGPYEWTRSSTFAIFRRVGAEARPLLQRLWEGLLFVLAMVWAGICVLGRGLIAAFKHVRTRPLIQNFFGMVRFILRQVWRIVRFLLGLVFKVVKLALRVLWFIVTLPFRILGALIGWRRARVQQVANGDGSSVMVRPWPWRTLFRRAVELVAILLLIGGAVLAYGLTNTGELILHSSEDGVEVGLLCNGFLDSRYEQVRLRQGENLVSIPAGQISFRPTERHRGYGVNVPNFSLPRGGRYEVTVSATDDRKVLRAVLAAGGNARVEEINKGRAEYRSPLAPIPFGELRIEAISFEGIDAVRDADLEGLGGLKKLTSLNLRGTAVTDAGLRTLRGIEWSELNLSGTAITDAGLDQVRMKPQSRLDLTNSQVTIRGVTRFIEVNTTCDVIWDADRLTAHLAFANGWTLVVAAGEELRQVRLERELPPQPFRIVEIRGDTPVGQQQPYVLRTRLKKLTDLHTLHFENIPLTDPDFYYILRSIPSLKSVTVTSSKITDAAFGNLGDEPTPSFIRLGLAGTHITDRGLVSLRALKKLEALDLSGLAITDAGLNNLRDMTTLRELTLTGTFVTDACLKVLEGLPRLTRLDLRFTPVTDAGAARLRSVLPKCLIEHAHRDINRHAAQRVLELGGALHVSIEGKEHAVTSLADLPVELFEVTRIDLNGNTKVRDLDLQLISKLPGLNSLHLGGTPVTDAGVRQLKVLKRLVWLNLRDAPQVSYQVRLELKKLWPHVEIVPDPMKGTGFQSR